MLWLVVRTLVVSVADGVAQVHAGQNGEDVGLNGRDKKFEAVDRGDGGDRDDRGHAHRSGKAALGYSTVEDTQSRPRSSKAILIGLLIIGSDAKSRISNPSGTRSAFRSSSAVRGSVVRTKLVSAQAARPATTTAHTQVASPASHLIRFRTLTWKP